LRKKKALNKSCRLNVRQISSYNLVVDVGKQWSGVVTRPSFLMTKWEVRQRPLSYTLRKTRDIRTL